MIDYIEAAPEVCIPSLCIPIILDGPTPDDITLIESFVQRYEYVYSRFGKNNFIVKLPFVTASKPSYCSGYKGIVQAIKKYSKPYLRHRPSGFLGYIPYVIIQPRYFLYILFKF